MASVVDAVRDSSPRLKRAIIPSLTVQTSARSVKIRIVTDTAFTEEDVNSARQAVKPYIPEYFSYEVEISKLSPDEKMVARKIWEIITKNFKAVAAAMDEKDVRVYKTDAGFKFVLSVPPAALISGEDMCEKIRRLLQNVFCGDFWGECVAGRSAAELEVEARQDETEFEIPVRTFPICDFKFIEGTAQPERAVCIADLNLVKSQSVVICGTLEEIHERTYTNRQGAERSYLSLVISDETGNAYATYFTRRKSYDKIKELKVGDSVVLTGSNEEYRGSLRYTANTVDYGRIQPGYKIERRASKPVPAYYHYVYPQPYSDLEQTDIFTKKVIPDCLKNVDFVVFDLETTGLNSSPVSGNMDAIIEIGAYKISGGEICESFSTFINPRRKLSDEIIKLTGIREDMVKDAPTCEQVMPDFFKFCSGCILVGHNIAGFDFKFVDYYCAKEGYILERKIIDTIPLSQQLLALPNYKLNTVAERFNIAFNHHRATDDALATAKIFIELIKLKKSLPKT